MKCSNTFLQGLVEHEVSNLLWYDEKNINETIFVTVLLSGNGSREAQYCI
jgi:hypothetical protein